MALPRVRDGAAGIAGRQLPSFRFSTNRNDIAKADEPEKN